MEPLKLAEVVQAAKSRVIRGVDECFTGVTIDSRKVRPGDLFVAIEGKRLDGHRFVREALAAGAAGVVISDERVAPEQGAVLLVTDTRRALLDIAGFYRSRYNIRTAAVTGSNGKTTTKEMLGAMLSTRWQTVVPEGSYNNDIGVPLTLLRLNAEIEAAVFELEMNEPGGTLRLAKACRPQLGIITNIGDTHLEWMGDRHGVAAEKAELLQALPSDGVAVLNTDDDMVMELGRKCWRGEIVTFGFGTADFQAVAVKDLGFKGMSFQLASGEVVSLPVPGRHNVANCLAALAAAQRMGVELTAAIEAVRDFKLPPMRLRVVRLNRVVLIDDSYNANPQSVQAALGVLRDNAEPGSRVALLGAMLELGHRSRELHESVGRQAAEIVDRLITVGHEALAIGNAACDAGMSRTRVIHCESAAVAADVVFDFLRDGDTILVKGSRAVGLEQISQRIIEHYETNTSKVH
ncbi:MAG: UDP-N-acetylmuramoyl-tripeptide--D-alanyl-D-alanine ligase [candidate division WOR-3 bacterium]